ncbi:hypothetical protein BC332_34014 [Capsicum chinense]|nr:hypothetical protein BC332_34014 [Capsicum chinense]
MTNLVSEHGSRSQGVCEIVSCRVLLMGKSKLAKTSYNLNFDKFDGNNFLADVNKTSERYDGLVSLQRQLLSNVLGNKVENLYNADDGVIKIQEAIQCRIVLLVLDGVDNSDQLNAVLRIQEVKPIWGPPGTGKTKTVTSLLYVLSKIRCRTLTYAPTNVAMLGVTKKQIQNAQSLLQYDKYGLGDIVLFCNRERMKINDHEDLFDVFLKNHVNVLASCLSLNNGWRIGILSMICLLDDPEEEYRNEPGRLAHGASLIASPGSDQGDRRDQVEGVELAAYKLKDVENKRYNKWEDTKGESADPRIWGEFVEAFLDQFFPLELRKAKAEEFINLKQGKMSIQEYTLKFNQLTYYSLEMTVNMRA